MPQGDPTATPSTAAVTEPQPGSTPTTEPAPSSTATPSAATPGTLTQADVDRVVQERLARERAKFADYEEMKTKAKAFDEAEAARMTEQERLQQQLEQATAERDRLRVEGLRRDVADELQVPANLRAYVNGTTDEELRASATKVLADFAAANPAPAAPAAPALSGPRPTERLIPGASPTASVTTETAYPASWAPRPPRTS